MSDWNPYWGPARGSTVVTSWSNEVGPMTRGTHLVITADGIAVTPDHLCPDLLRYSNIGGADGWRGRVVRAFFWLMRAWPVR